MTLTSERKTKPKTAISTNDLFFYSCARAKNKFDMLIMLRILSVARIKRKDCKFATATIQPYFVDLVRNYSFTLLLHHFLPNVMLKEQSHSNTLNYFWLLNINIGLAGLPKSWLF